MSGNLIPLLSSLSALRRTTVGLVLATGLAVLAHATDTPSGAPALASFWTRLAAHGLPPSAVAFWMQPVQTAVDTAPRYSHQADVPFNPASVMKLVTTLAALDRWGPAHTFGTEVLLDGAVDAGVLHGNLYLRGGGDPSLTQERTSALLREIRARGIHTIAGDLILDDRFYSLPTQDPAAFDQAPERPYNAPPAALLVNYNTVTLTLNPENGSVVARTEPPALPVRAELQTTLGDCQSWQDGLITEITTESIKLEGEYPLSCGAKTAWLNLFEPRRNTELHVRALWQELGGQIQGQVRAGLTPAQAKPLLLFASPPLALLVRDINKFSNNVMARMLFLNLGAEAQGAPATLEKARATLQQWLGARGITAAGWHIDNGAGLSREARLTVAGLGHLLHWGARQPWFFDFAASLPQLGVDGTLQKRALPTGLAAHAYLKTGSLRGVRTLAGYVWLPSGLHTWILLINDPNTAAASLLQDSLLTLTSTSATAASPLDSALNP